jgi:hypothetical protein
MFSAIQEVVLSSAAIDEALAFFENVLVFERADDLTGPGAELAGCIAGAPASEVRSVLLTKGAATGGFIRLVTWPDHPASPAHLSNRDLGLYAITLYTRDIDARLAHAAELGYAHSGAHEYVLPGSDFTVREALIAGPDGLNVAFVEWLPKQHRCLLASRPDLVVSEVATSGQIVADGDTSLLLYRDALGADVYLDRSFGGPGPELMGQMSPGQKMRVMLIRGAGSGNARFELIERLPGGSRPLAPAHAALTLRVDDLAATLGRLAALAGTTVLPGVSKWGGVCVETANLVRLELRQA